MISRNIRHPDWRLPANISAVVTTRKAGNFATHVGDDPAQVLLRRRQLQRQLPLEQPISWLTQQHTATVSRWPNLLRPSDAIIADAPQVACAVLTADCLPILLCSQDGQFIAAVHAGWRGLASGILRNTIKQLPVAAQQLTLWIGPAICQRCFQVGEDVRQAFLPHFQLTAIQKCFTPCPKSPGKWRADLSQLAVLQAQSLGIKSANISLSGWCTACQEQHWYSHRRRQEPARLASIIWRKF